MNFKKIKISSNQDHLFSDFKTLYVSSFPEFEQRTNEQQAFALGHENYILNAYLENDHFIGFISYWEFDTFIYIEHFAITNLIRGKGYGFKVLKDFMDSTNKIVILEIDPVVDDISSNRLRFYHKCNFISNSFIHKHPPYRNEFQAHDLMILSSKRALTQQEYDVFNHSLCHVVMQLD